MTLQDVRDTVATLTDQLTADLAAIWTRITDEQAALLTRWPSGTAHSRQRALAALQRAVRALAGQARTVITTTVPDVYDQAWTAGQAAALAEVSDLLASAAIDPGLLVRHASDDLADLLAATAHIEDTTKTLIRTLARDHIGDALVTGKTAVQAGRALASDLADAGITAVTYRDGSRHGLAEYASMVVRTRTAEAFQQAGYATYASMGVTHVELLDNPACGLASHEGIPKANGLIVTLAVAQQYPTSHPNCVRSSIARVDITSDAEAAAANRAQYAPGGRSTTFEQNADQGGVERAREQKVAARARRKQLTERTARTRSGTLSVRADATVSAAQARHVAATTAGQPAAAERHGRVARPRTSSESGEDAG